MENGEKKTVSRTVIDREVIMRKYHVHIKNFRNLKDVKVTLSPLTILTGENGSGKSTFFKALLFLKHNHTHEAAKKLKYVIDDDINLGGWDQIANDPKKPISIKITEETWGYDHQVEEIYDIDNCPFELNPTEEYAERWLKSINKYGDSFNLDPILPKSKRLISTSERGIQRSEREFVFDQNKLESITFKTGLSNIKFKFRYLTRPYEGDLHYLDQTLYPLAKNHFYFTLEDIDTKDRVIRNFLLILTRLFLNINKDVIWSPEAEEEEKYWDDFLNNLEIVLLGGEQLTKHSAFRKFVSLALRRFVEPKLDQSYLYQLKMIFEILDELNEVLYLDFEKSFTLGTTRKLPEPNYLVHKLQSSIYYGIIDQLDVEKHHLNLQESDFSNLMKSLLCKWLVQFELGTDIRIAKSPDIVKIMLSTFSGKYINLSETSSGTLQLLPILYLLIRNSDDIRTFSVQQPELHLHPRLHSIFVDFVTQILSPSFEEMLIITRFPYMEFLFSNGKKTDYKPYFPADDRAIDRFNKGDALHCYTVPTHLIIETHSEHLLKKLQVLVSQGKTLQLWPEGHCSGEDVKLKDALSIYYFAKDAKGNTRAIELELNDNGFFKTETPKGFFDESLDLNRQLLLGRN